ncbi:MAG: ketoacyl-ACP synthase III [Chloroflexota bacterium]
MIGIEAIGSYIPEGRISNYERKEQLGFDDTFIERKIGIQQVAIKAQDEDTSDLCVKAYECLVEKTGCSVEDIQALIVITQNPDTNIPHTSAIVHGKLGLPERCACFDVSLGCSGFVYGLSVLQSFMQANGLQHGVLFTADPYSKIINPNDKSTASLFGDAATATLVSNKPHYTTQKFTFGTIGQSHRELICTDGILEMNGRAIFNFAAKFVPPDMEVLLASEELALAEVDKFIFHQGSKYIIDTIAKRLKIAPEQVVFDAADYGNVVSSSIPVILEKEMTDAENSHIVICGFGVGLSWASALLKRNKRTNL